MSRLMKLKIKKCHGAGAKVDKMIAAVKRLLPLAGIPGAIKVYISIKLRNTFLSNAGKSESY
jgi:hypothetical protein